MMIMDDNATRADCNKYYRSLEPYLCKECNMVWQMSEDRKLPDYLTEFPKYGCTIKVCTSCRYINKEELEDMLEDKEGYLNSEKES